MQMKGRKATVFITNSIIFVLFLVAIFIFTPDFLPRLAIPALGLFFANGLTFVGGNTLDKWIRKKSDFLEYKNDE